MHDKLSREDLDLELELDEPVRARPIAPGRRATTSRIPYAARFPIAFRRAAATAAGPGGRDGNGVAAGADAAVDRAAQTSSGQALPSDVRRRFEDALGADLS